MSTQTDNLLTSLISEIYELTKEGKCPKLYGELFTPLTRVCLHEIRPEDFRDSVDAFFARVDMLYLKAMDGRDVDVYRSQLVDYSIDTSINEIHIHLKCRTVVLKYSD